jgi:hypothetical protein
VHQAVDGALRHGGIAADLQAGGGQDDRQAAFADDVADQRHPGTKCPQLALQPFQQVQVDRGNLRVTVGAGGEFAADPVEPFTEAAPGSVELIPHRAQPGLSDLAALGILAQCRSLAGQAHEVFAKRIAMLLPFGFEAGQLCEGQARVACRVASQQVEQLLLLEHRQHLLRLAEPPGIDEKVGQVAIGRLLAGHRRILSPLGNSAIYQSGSNIGIGMTTPSGILQVAGGTAAAATNATSVTITAQAAGSGNQNGGNINLTPGSGTGTGTAGVVNVSSTPVDPGTGQPAAFNSTIIVSPVAASGSWIHDAFFTASSTGANNAARLIGIESTAVQSSATSTVAIAYGIAAFAKNGSTGTITSGYGARLEAQNAAGGTMGWAYGATFGATNYSSGSITTANGILTGVTNSGSGGITTGYGIEVTAPVNSGGGTFGTYYGIYIHTPVAATTNYALYSQGGTNYFGGKVGIGTTLRRWR